MRRLVSQIAVTGLILINFWSCKKNEEGNNCEQIQQVKITGFKSSYYVGDTISLGTNLIPPISLFNWNFGDNPNSISGGPTVFIYPCSKYDEGWYYLSVSYPDCASHNDSVYISVINKPATAPCTPTNNTVSFSAIPNISFSTTSWTMDPDFNCKLLNGYYAYGYPDFNIYFNFFWNNKEPEDGEYNISNTITFDDNDPYSVFIASNYSDIYFEANPGKVYVSHVNGKISVTFCSLTLIGDNGGPSYTTTAIGALTAP
jgi:hypothetical protein